MIEKFFLNAKYVASANNLNQIPNYKNPEIAFAGCSNSGKSTLINTIVSRKMLCRTSKNPGCTKTINFFEIPDIMQLVDLPGYGYARRSKSLREWWGETIILYLKGRPNLHRVFILVDSLHYFKKTDYEFMKILGKSAVNYQIIFTKADKISLTQQNNLIKKVQSIHQEHTAMHPEIILTSSKEKIGIEKIQLEIINIYNNYSSKNKSVFGDKNHK